MYFMLIYNLIEYSDSYPKTPASLWHYSKDEPALTNAGATANFHAANSALFKFKQKITGKTDNANAGKDVEIMVPLKYLSNVRELLKCL